MRNPKLGLTSVILTILAAFAFTIQLNTLYAAPYNGPDNSSARSTIENNNNNAPSVLHLLPSDNSDTNNNSDTNTGTNTTTHTNTDTNRNTHSNSKSNNNNNNNDNNNSNNNDNNNSPPSKTNSGSSDVNGGGAAAGSANSHAHSNDKTDQKSHHHGVRDKNINSDHSVNNHIQNLENKIKHKFKVGDIPFP